MRPTVGLVRGGSTGHGGAGLWLTHALVDVRHHRAPAGYTIYLQVGERT